MSQQVAQNRIRNIARLTDLYLQSNSPVYFPTELLLSCSAIYFPTDLFTFLLNYVLLYTANTFFRAVYFPIELFTYL